MDFKQLMQHLNTLTINDKLPILELLSHLAEDGRFDKSGAAGIKLSDDQAIELLRRLRAMGLESTWDESIRTKKGYNQVEETCAKADRTLWHIRHAMSCIQMSSHTLASLSHMAWEKLFAENNYTKRYT